MPNFKPSTEVPPDLAARSLSESVLDGERPAERPLTRHAVTRPVDAAATLELESVVLWDEFARQRPPVKRKGSAHDVETSADAREARLLLH